MILFLLQVRRRKNNNSDCEVRCIIEQRCKEEKVKDRKKSKFTWEYTDWNE